MNAGAQWTFWLLAGALTLACLWLLLRPMTASQGATQSPATGSRRRRVVAGAIALLMPLAAVFAYGRLGAPNALLPQATQPISHRLGNSEMADLVRALAARLESSPDDANGWFMLARSYQAMERWDESAKAYRQALRLVPGDPDLLADLADVVATQHGGQLEGEPRALLEKALAQDAAHPKGTALLAMAEFRAGRLDAAIGHWERLHAQALPGSDAATLAERGLQQARAIKDRMANQPPPGP
jgi:cytochrome c-type biogenesis protein CcmH